jgi:hypothetical protein
MKGQLMTTHLLTICPISLFRSSDQVLRPDNYCGGSILMSLL